MPLFLSVSLGSLHSEKLVPVVDSHSRAKDRAPAEEHLWRPLLPHWSHWSPRLTHGGRTQPHIFGVASALWNSIESERISGFQRGFKELTWMIQPE